MTGPRRAILSKSNYQSILSYQRKSSMSPRVRMAMRLYGNGSMTQKEAAQAAGLHKVYVANLVNKSPLVANFIDKIQGELDEQAVDMGKVIKAAGRKAIENIYLTMEHGDNPALKLKAAIDLADRSPETSKIQRVQVEAFTLGSADVELLAQAMAEGRTAQEQFALEVRNGFDRTNQSPEPQTLLSDVVSPSK
ncbi:hypothetical protein UFOVP1537_8 [uncultured Caudovirales phage]|uniref:Terminase small subunit n=2 Tax=root TaxID=1 RepID=A0A6J7XR09_9CAUD|nr:hypothetical protein UFOVP825_26 [uncultured Caudovirales phage]CAB4171183.1 hypothetical protein UFOVP915_8 [uncultured Caudovirales phage]CAB4177208.1 hypothetical protein UFOVP1000_25 [uncultured Caudovirales phage]CAB4183365.1 hypothetical protein UFOVP1092_53 [uncultured Caudovirales phage]CAB4187276.1 hypothetical protein UFOVP1152_4 [uncultured Caudovirales phage]